MGNSQLPTDETQFWIVSGIAALAVLLLISRLLRKKSCGGCSSKVLPKDGGKH